MDLVAIIALLVFVPVFLLLIWFVVKQCRGPPVRTARAYGNADGNSATHKLSYQIGDIESPKLSYQHYFFDSQFPPGNSLNI